MTCDHKTATTPYCPNCGKQLVVPADQSLKEHIESNIDRITKQLNDDPDQKYEASRTKSLDKWITWRAWVKSKMEKTDAE